MYGRPVCAQTGKPPYPGIVVPLGGAYRNEIRTKLQYSYQNLARKALVVLAYDPLHGAKTSILRPTFLRLVLAPPSSTRQPEGR